MDNAGAPVTIQNPDGGSPVVLICEHAAHHIPANLQDLGLKPSDRFSHAAWDPGALAVSQHISEQLGAKLVASNVSRLVYDCNRPPDAPDAMPTKSELIEVPGNIGLTDAQRADRVAAYYTPFRDAVCQTLADTQTPVLVTIHSFTPVYHGKTRDVEIGILHDTDTRLADAILAQAAGAAQIVQRNQPYGPQHGVTHTLKEHGIKPGHLNVMFEVRNDLIATAAQQATIAAMLSNWIAAALDDLNAKGQLT